METPLERDSAKPEEKNMDSTSSVIEKLRGLREKFEAYAKIEMSERQIRAEIGNIPWIGDLVDRNINAGIFPSEDLAKIELFVSRLQTVKSEIDAACKALGKSPVNNLEFDYYPRLIETISEFKEMVGNIQKLLLEGILWAS